MKKLLFACLVLAGCQKDNYASLFAKTYAPEASCTSTTQRGGPDTAQCVVGDAILWCSAAADTAPTCKVIAMTKAAADAAAKAEAKLKTATSVPAPAEAEPKK